MINNENNVTYTLEEIKTNKQKQVKMLNYTQLKYLPRNYNLEYSYLKKLNLSNNNIHFLSYNLFNNLKNLKLLDLSYNFITKINKDTFKYLQKLIILHLNNNKIEKINNYAFNFLYKLTSLNLNNNKLLDIEEYGFYNISNLKYLSLQNNLKELYIHPNNYNYFKNIEYFYISYKTKIDRFKNIKVLSITNIHEIKSLNIYNLQNLYFIKISNTYIKKIYTNTFYNLPLLNYLNISYNYDLKEIDDNIFYNTNNIKIIFLNYNPNLYLLKYIFNLPYLQFLHLNDNNLNYINKNMCLNCKSLKELFLQNNNLENFDLQIPTFLNKLYLQNNHLNGIMIKKNKLQILDLQNNLLTKIYIYKNNIPNLNLNLSNNLLLQNKYDKNYIFPYTNQILYVLNSTSQSISYNSCFEIYNNITKFNCLKINMIEIFDIIKICNFPQILIKYFYKLYLLCLLKQYIKNKKKLKKNYFMSIKHLEIIYNIHYTHKYIYKKLSEHHLRKYILDFIYIYPKEINSLT